MVWLFWTAVGFLLYTAFGYPVLLWCLSRFVQRRHQPRPIHPFISIIVPAHNEERIIGRKLDNLLEQSYPSDKMQIIVVSDGSSDRTEQIVRGFGGRGVTLMSLALCHGKHHAQKLARDASSGEILVFTDAAIMLPKSGIEQIISNFSDPMIGCVSSEDEIVGSRSFGETAYVRFEMWLRKLESRIGSAIGASGSLFAARRDLCEDWHIEQSSDFFIPLHAAERKLRVVVDSQCRAEYGVTGSNAAEFNRKVRTIVHGLDVVASHRSLLNPFRHGIISWQLLSHKVFRWCVPFALMALLVAASCLWNHGALYKVMVVMQLAFYAAGIMGLASDWFSRFKPFRLAGFFLIGNTATFVAWLKLCRGEKYVVWQPTPRS